MKRVTKKSTIQKIIFAIVIVLLLVSFTLVPATTVYADEDDDHGWSIGGTLAKEVLGFFNWICDVLMGGLNNVMLGANGVGSAMLDKNNPNLTDDKSWINVKDPSAVDKTDDRTIVFENGEIDTSITGWFGAAYAIPNMLYSPENIFANNIAALDINFLRQNSYQSIYAGGKASFKDSADEKAESAVKTLRGTIASWYKSFRNIAVVGLLSVLIYLGIRILISSTASDKAKYKETLKDWVVALCLVFVIHFIMSGILMLTDKCTELFGESVDKGYTVVLEGESDNKDMAFHTNLMGLIRFSAQNRSASTTAFYSIMYWALVIYTCIFTIMYFKRFLYMAFFTMIAPLVALTYPIDKVGDGKSQAFNMWFKEYTMNAIIQPVHLILYTVFVGEAYHLVAKNPVYALVALGFLIPAEKFVKKMFGLDKAESTSGFGSFAGGAMAMSAIKSLGNLGSGGKNKKGAGDKNGSDGENLDDNIFMPSSQDGDLSTFGNDENDASGVRQQMLDAEDENFGTENWDAQQRDALAREENQNDSGMQYSDEEYDQILRDSGYDEDTIRQMTGNNSSSNTSNNELKPKKSVVRALGRVVGRGASATGRQIWRNKGKYARNAARFAVKGGMRAMGAAALAAPALAAGITTGDLSKTAQFVGAGAMVGSGLGAKAYDGIAAPLAGGVANTARNSRNAFEEEYFGIEEATRRQRERQNEKATKAFMQNENEIKKYRKLKADMSYKGSYKDLMSAAADYKVAGITDDKMIQNALKAEARNNHGEVGGNDHKQYVDMASFASQNGFGKDHIEDDKKRTAFENVIDSKLSNQKDKRKAAQTLAEIFDRGDMYKNVGRFK